MEEQWLPVVGYENRYEISDQGRLRTIPRMIRHRAGLSSRDMKVRYLKLHTTRFGHLRVSLVGDLGRDFRKPCLVHRLVAEAFIPNPKNKPQVNHIDNNPGNNKVDNLVWGTPQENMLHAANCNRMRRLPGECNPNVKLTEQQVIEIRAKYIPRLYSQRMLAREYHVDQTLVEHIVNRKTWTHI